MIKRKVIYGFLSSDYDRKEFETEVDEFITNTINEEEFKLINMSTQVFGTNNGYLDRIRTEIVYEEIPTRKVLTEKEITDNETKKTLNIWEGFNFKEKKTKSALNYINEQNSSFISKTKGILNIETLCRNSEDCKNLQYDVYVVCKPLGNYRKQILSVVETYSENHFPVTIFSTGLTDKVFSSVEEKDFLTKLEEFITIPTIKRTIENLYTQSKENQNE